MAHLFSTDELLQEGKGSFFLPLGNRSTANTTTVAQRHTSAFRSVLAPAACKCDQNVKKNRLSRRGRRAGPGHAVVPAQDALCGDRCHPTASAAPPERDRDTLSAFQSSLKNEHLPPGEQGSGDT